MVLQDYQIEGDYIKVSKAELEKWRDHYFDTAYQQKEIGSPLDLFYLGKRDVLIDMIKMFEPLMG